MHVVLGICLVCALLGVAAGYFLSVYAVIVLAVAGGVIWFSMIIAVGKDKGRGTSGGIGLAFTAGFITIFLLTMVITACAVGLNFNLSDASGVGSWLKRTLLR